MSGETAVGRREFMLIGVVVVVPLVILSSAYLGLLYLGLSRIGDSAAFETFEAWHYAPHAVTVVWAWATLGALFLIRELWFGSQWHSPNGRVGHAAMLPWIAFLAPPFLAFHGLCWLAFRRVDGGDPE